MEFIAAVVEDPNFQFSLPEPEPCAPPYLQVGGGGVGLPPLVSALVHSQGGGGVTCTFVLPCHARNQVGELPYGAPQRAAKSEVENDSIK